MIIYIQVLDRGALNNSTVGRWQSMNYWKGDNAETLTRHC